MALEAVGTSIMDPLSSSDHPLQDGDDGGSSPSPPSKATAPALHRASSSNQSTSNGVKADRPARPGPPHRAFSRFEGSSSSSETANRISPHGPGISGTPPLSSMEAMEQDNPSSTFMEQEAEAGPSDYWRRSPTPPSPVQPSPPPAWRQLSTQKWPQDLEDGPGDKWYSNGQELPAIAGDSHAAWNGTGNDVDQGEMSGIDQEENRGSTRSGTVTPQGVDREAYERRMRGALQDGSAAPLNGHSPLSSRLKMDEEEDPVLILKKRLKGTDSKGALDEKVGDVEGSEGGRNGDELGDLEFPPRDDVSVDTPSTISTSASIRDSRLLHRPSPLKRLSTPYLHPSVSRLRSHLRTSSSSTQATLPRRPSDLSHARIASHFSQISLARSDSTAATSKAPEPPRRQPRPDQTPAFDFYPLRKLSAQLFAKQDNKSVSVPRPPVPRKASSILGIPTGNPPPESVGGHQDSWGTPTVMDVRDMIAIGTDTGQVVVFGFDQKVRCILQNDAAASSGPVTTVTTSPDNTFVAVGHASGNIHLYDLSRPTKPARTTNALALQQVQSGQKEGHVQGSRILHIGFVGSRHTSIVSGDEHGRAFWWSLGKVIGVESNDVVRMLGNYPPKDGLRTPEENGSGMTKLVKKPTTLFAVSPLPLGKAPHPADEYSFTALLTPVKLVIVGMKPTARTWFRKMRVSNDGKGGLVGCAQWSKTVDESDGSRVFAYSWDCCLRFLRLRVGAKTTEQVERKLPGPPPDFIEEKVYESACPIVALQWYDKEHIVLVTNESLLLLHVKSLKIVESQTLQPDLLSSRSERQDSSPSTVSSKPTCNVRAHRGKLFVLALHDVQVANLQRWNDRILARVHQGDFLEAIQVALAYYEDRAEGNLIGLPDDPVERRSVIGMRMKELIRSSLQWAFSEDRMRDDTHYSSDGRGVDLTELFEGLAGSCIEASLALKDMSLLFDTAYEHFANAGISNIFLRYLQPFIFDGRIREVPPAVVQALISMHVDNDDLASAEAIIWNVDPMSLDINQAVTLCEAHRMWDALIHVYTRTIGDFVAPIVKLLELVKTVERRRSSPDWQQDNDSHEDSLALDAYKLFAYLDATLSGLSYPSEDPLPSPQANGARKSIYDFIYSYDLLRWPDGSDGSIVHVLEPDIPYPYLDLILRFDVEAFLHSMDMAFEDSYLNATTSSSITRQTIVQTLLRTMTFDRFPSADITLLHIFVARNLPKYPQFLSLPPDASHDILVSLATDTDQSMLEDRQLAAEYLLSAYTPVDTSSILDLFEQAGFYRILRSMYQRQGDWRNLVLAHVKDPELGFQLFDDLDDLLRDSHLSTKHQKEVEGALESTLQSLLDLSISQTAFFLNKHMPRLHSKAIELLTRTSHKQMAYLRSLLDPDEMEDPSGLMAIQRPDPASVEASSRTLYVSLLTQNDSSAVIGFLDKRGPEFFDLRSLADQFEKSQFIEGRMWALDRQGDAPHAFKVAGDVFQSRAVDLAQALVEDATGDLHLALESVQSTCQMAIRLCKEHSAAKEPGVEDLWFTVLHSVMEMIQSVGNVTSTAPSTQVTSVLNDLRSLVQETLQSLVASSSTSLSFPRLFKRLIDDSTMDSAKSKSKQTQRAYAEYRTILTGMLDSYRSEGEMLSMTTKMVEEDLFVNIAEVTRKRQMGWRLTRGGTCAVCGKEAFGEVKDVGAERNLVVVASGEVRHGDCIA